MLIIFLCTTNFGSLRLFRSVDQVTEGTHLHFAGKSW